MRTKVAMTKKRACNREALGLGLDQIRQAEVTGGKSLDFKMNF